MRVLSEAVICPCVVVVAIFSYVCVVVVICMCVLRPIQVFVYVVCVGCGHYLLVLFVCAVVTIFVWCVLLWPHVFVCLYCGRDLYIYL